MLDATDSFSDLSADFEELKYLYEDRIASFEKLLKKIKDKNSYQYKNTFDSLSEIAGKISESLNNNYKRLNTRTSNFSELISIKNSSFEILRNLQQISASFFTSPNWQSPSFLHSLNPQAGLDLNLIAANENDYKRDVHVDGGWLERKYRNEYTDCPLPYKLLIRTYATSSGMAAFTTILNFLAMEGIVKTGALMGKSTYFEAKILITKLFGKKIIEFEESDTDSIIYRIKKYKPEVLFIDSLANSCTIPLPDLNAIFNFLKSDYKEKITIVLDNTGLSLFFQPLLILASKRNSITVFSYESLNKYTQFGMDRVTGGMITSYGKNIGKLFQYREYLGTNLPDNSVYAIPTPNRKLLEKRLLRLSRNASFLAQSLQEYITINKLKKIKSVVYPSLSNHPGFNWSRKLAFTGSYFTFEIDKKYQNQRFFKHFLQKTISLAKKRKVQLIAGSSFGLNTTRIYITALNSDFGDPFIRISVGTECMEEMGRIKDVLIKVIDR